MCPGWALFACKPWGLAVVQGRDEHTGILWSVHVMTLLLDNAPDLAWGDVIRAESACQEPPLRLAEKFRPEVLATMLEHPSAEKYKLDCMVQPLLTHCPEGEVLESESGFTVTVLDLGGDEMQIEGLTPRQSLASLRVRVIQAFRLPGTTRLCFCKELRLFQPSEFSSSLDHLCIAGGDRLTVTLLPELEGFTLPWSRTAHGKPLDFPVGDHFHTDSSDCPYPEISQHVRNALVAIAEHAQESCDSGNEPYADDDWFKGFDPESRPQESEDGHFVTAQYRCRHCGFVTIWSMVRATCDIQTGMVKWELSWEI